MGSSASIMQATLSAGGETQNSKITFHCQDLREGGDKDPATPCRGDPVTSSVCEVGGPAEEAVTRYFPIIQSSNFIPRIEVIEHGVLPGGYMERTECSKDRTSRENYYYSCEICSKGFMFKGSLNRHLARHNGREGEEIKPAPRQFPIKSRSGAGASEVRYQLKDPRLYEQHSKLQKPGTKAPTNPKAYRKPRDKCSLCGVIGHTTNTCKLSRNLVLGQKVLAICSCLKCNKSFDDVDKLKEHIARCKGFSRATKHVLQSECNVR